MNPFKYIDQYLFGTNEENEFSKQEKLWYYLPLSFGVAVTLFVHVAII